MNGRLPALLLGLVCIAMSALQPTFGEPTRQLTWAYVTEREYVLMDQSDPVLRVPSNGDIDSASWSLSGDYFALLEPAWGESGSDSIPMLWVVKAADLTVTKYECPDCTAVVPYGHEDFLALPSLHLSPVTGVTHYVDINIEGFSPITNQEAIYSKTDDLIFGVPHGSLTSEAFAGVSDAGQLFTIPSSETFKEMSGFGRPGAVGFALKSCEGEGQPIGLAFDPLGSNLGWHVTSTRIQGYEEIEDFKVIDLRSNLEGNLIGVAKSCSADRVLSIPVQFSVDPLALWNPERDAPGPRRLSAQWIPIECKNGCPEDIVLRAPISAEEWAYVGCAADGTPSGCTNTLFYEARGLRLKIDDEVAEVYVLPVPSPKRPALSVASTGTERGWVGYEFDQQLIATGGVQPFRWLADGLPPGLHLDEKTGVLSGVPSRAGDYQTSITVQDASGISETDQLSIEVAQSERRVVTELLDGSRNCAITTTAERVCWAEGNAFEFGNSRLVSAPESLPGSRGLIFRPHFDFASEGAYGHECGISGARDVYCHGDNGFGQVGVGSPGADAEAGFVELPAAATHIELASNRTCARLVTGDVYCWVEADRSSTDDPAATPELNVDLSASESFVMASDATCATKDNRVKCWDQLSTIETSFETSSVIAWGLLESGSVCRVLLDGDLVCTDSQGIDDVIDGAMTGLEGEQILELEGDGQGICIRTNGGVVKCNRPERIDFEEVGLADEAVDITFGSGGLCALLANGSLWCGDPSNLERVVGIGP